MHWSGEIHCDRALNWLHKRTRMKRVTSSVNDHPLKHPISRLLLKTLTMKLQPGIYTIRQSGFAYASFYPRDKDINIIVGYGSRDPGAVQLVRIWSFRIFDIELYSRYILTFFYISVGSTTSWRKLWLIHDRGSSTSWWTRSTPRGIWIRKGHARCIPQAHHSTSIMDASSYSWKE